ncbi:MAG: ABC transporter permease [Gemmatimonadota bacterium]|nr:ABC transporter permease [Gemmatimonadota bacterium]
MDISGGGTGRVLYRILLRAYSPSFRREAGPELLDMFDAARAEARAQGGVLWWARYWARLLADVAVTAGPTRWRQLRRSDRDGGQTVDSILQDLRYAARSLRRSPGFTAVAVVTTALGIGATATIYSVANAVMFRSLTGVRDSHELVTVHATSSDGSSFHAFSVPNFRDLRAGENGLGTLAAFSLLQTSARGAEESEAVAGLMVSEDYFRVLGTRPALGRLLAVGDHDPGGGPVAVLSHGSWQGRFAGDPGVVGQTVSLGGHAFTVVGVAEQGFTGHLALLDIEAFVPLAFQPLLEGHDGRFLDRNFDWLELIGRRADGVSTGEARAALTAIAERLAEEYVADNRGSGVDVRPYSNVFAQQSGAVGGFFTLLLAVAGMVLVVAAVNVGGMLLARGTDRRAEMALRLALGARRARLVRLMLAESVVLFLLGGAGGVALAFAATAVLSSVQLPIPFPIIFDFTPDRRVLLFSLGLALASGTVFGLVPAMGSTRSGLRARLGGGGRLRVREWFVVAQIAVSAVLLTGAGLFLRSLSTAASIDVGMRSEDVHILSTNVGILGYEREKGRAFFERLLAEASVVPGVEAAGLVRMPPLTFANETTSVPLPGAPDGRVGTDVNRVSAGYFNTMRVEIVEGRAFRDAEPAAVVINQTLAARLSSGGSSIGRNVRLGSTDDAPTVRIVGVARDGRYRSLGDEGRSMLFLPFSGFYSEDMSLVVRARGDVGPALADLVRRADPDLPLIQNAAYEDLIGLSFLPNRVAAITASSFGLLGLVLSAIGLYGVLAYAVARRTREIGIRLALGAPRRSVHRMVLRGGARLALIGMVLGLAGALASTRLLRGLLYGVSPTDPLTLTAIGGLLGAVVVAACVVPASRATRTDPTEALRHE